MGLLLFSQIDERKSVETLTLELINHYYNDDYQEIEKLLPKLKKLCLDTLNKNIFIYCQSNILNFEASVAENEDEYYQNIASMELLMSTYISSEDNNFYKIDMLDSYLSMKFIEEIDGDYFQELIDLLKPNQNADNFYHQDWHLLNARFFRLKEDFHQELKHLDQAIIFSKKIGLKNWEHLTTLINKSYALMNTNQFYESKIVALEIIKNSDSNELAEFNLEGWLILNLLEKLYGNVDDEFLYLRIFMEKYYLAVLNQGLWNYKLDEMYLNNFDDFIYFLNCDSTYDALSDFDSINKIRERKSSDRISFYMPSNVELAINREIYACSSKENDQKTKNIYHRKLIEGLDRFINEEMYRTLDYNLVTQYIVELDPSKKETKDLYLNYRNEVLKYIELVIDEEKKGIINNDTFTQFFVHSLLEILFQNLDFLTSSEIETNFKYAEYFLHKMKKNDEFFDKTFAYEGLLIEAVIRTHKLGYKEFSKNIYKKIFNNNQNREIADQSSLFDNLDHLALGEIYAKVITDSNSISDIDSIIKNLNKINRGSLEISLAIEQTTNSELKKFLKLKIDQENARNKFFASDIDYKNIGKSSLEKTQDYIKNIISKSGSLSLSSIKEIQYILYPNIDLVSIQNKLSENEGLVVILHVPDFNTGIESFITILINKDDIQYQYINDKNITLKNFEEINSMITQYPNDRSLETIQLKSDFLSQKIFSKLQKNISSLSRLTFISNFDNQLNPYLFRLKNKWLIENHIITSQLSINTFLNSNFSLDKKNKYFGLGNINYQNHIRNYANLLETKEEIISSSKSFPFSTLLFQNDAHISEIKKLDLTSSIVHFATHNSAISKNGFTKLPALVISKSTEDDGYLDAFEIQELNLSNADIVLSACNTSSSLETNDNEAFSGLIKSFKYAGAKSVLATRWDIESFSATEFSSKYVKNLGLKIRPSNSVANIMREFISSENYRHPFYWSGYFVLEL